MIDRQKSVLNALDQVFPNNDKLFYFRHIYSNFKQKFPWAILKILFWQAVRSGSQALYKKYMKDICKINLDAHK